MVIEASIEDLLFTHVKALVLPTVHPIVWTANTSAELPVASRWLRVTHLPALRRPLTLADTDELRGSLQIDVISPRYAGPNTDTASLVAAHFKGRLRLYGAADIALEIISATVLPGIGTDKHYATPVSINYRAYARVPA